MSARRSPTSWRSPASASRQKNSCWLNSTARSTSTISSPRRKPTRSRALHGVAPCDQSGLALGARLPRSAFRPARPAGRACRSRRSDGVGGQGAGSGRDGAEPALVGRADRGPRKRVNVSFTEGKRIILTVGSAFPPPKPVRSGRSPMTALFVWRYPRPCFRPPRSCKHGRFLFAREVRHGSVSLHRARHRRRPRHRAGPPPQHWCAQAGIRSWSAARLFSTPRCGGAPPTGGRHGTARSPATSPRRMRWTPCPDGSRRRSVVVDLLFNNAGMGVRAAPMDEIPVEPWNDVVGVNLTGSFLCARAAFGLMRGRSRGAAGSSTTARSRPTRRARARCPTRRPSTPSPGSPNLALDGRPFDIACGQIDIGNALTDMAVADDQGVPQANRRDRPSSPSWTCSGWPTRYSTWPAYRLKPTCCS